MSCLPCLAITTGQGRFCPSLTCTKNQRKEGQRMFCPCLPYATIARENHKETRQGRLYPCLPYPAQPFPKRRKAGFIPVCLTTHLLQFYFLSPIWCKGAKKNTERHPENAPILMGNLEEDASSGVILQVDATNELSNQEH